MSNTFLKSLEYFKPKLTLGLTANNNNKNEKKLKKYYNIPPSFEEIELRYKERGLKGKVPDPPHLRA